MSERKGETTMDSTPTGTVNSNDPDIASVGAALADAAHAGGLSNPYYREADNALKRLAYRLERVAAERDEVLAQLVKMGGAKEETKLQVWTNGEEHFVAENAEKTQALWEVWLRVNVGEDPADYGPQEWELVPGDKPLSVVYEDPSDIPPTVLATHPAMENASKTPGGMKRVTMTAEKWARNAGPGLLATSNW